MIGEGGSHSLTLLIPTSGTGINKMFGQMQVAVGEIPYRFTTNMK
jgi:hypothetical protein